MAFPPKITHSDDATRMTFRVDKTLRREHGMGVIHFPGGFVEVTRCTDGSYFVHLGVDYPENCIDGLIEYANHRERFGRTPPQFPTETMADAAHVTRVALRVNGPFVEPEMRGIPREQAITEDPAFGQHANAKSTGEV
jgi:hypothetical protein